LKLEVEFHHGARLFAETGSSNVSATDREMSPKFVMQVDFDPKGTKNEIGSEIAKSQSPS